MLLSQTAGPSAGGEIFKGLRLADAGKGVTHDRLNQSKGPFGTDHVFRIYQQSVAALADLSFNLLQPDLFIMNERQGRIYCWS